MSFADVHPDGTLRRNIGATSTIPISNRLYDDIIELLQSFQKSCMDLKEKMNNLRQRSISQYERNELDRLLGNLKKQDMTCKNAIDSNLLSLNELPRDTSTIQKRATLSKLSKDYDRVKTMLQTLIQEFNALKVDNSNTNKNNYTTSNMSIFNNIPTSTSTASSSSSSSSSSSHYPNITNMTIANPFNTTSTDIPTSSTSNISPQHQQQQQQQQHDMIQFQSSFQQGIDIEQSIIEERHKDIVKMNQDLVLVKEMMTDIATLVNQQGDMIETIAESAESSHIKAKEGLQQIQQAASHQSTCILS